MRGRETNHRGTEGTEEGLGGSWVGAASVCFWLAVGGCGAGEVGVTATVGLRAPFVGGHAMVGVFDHAARPVEGKQLAAWGEEVKGQEGHHGYDWAMPVGTPVLAAHPGKVAEAGATAPFVCPIDGRLVEDQLVVRLVQEVGDGRVETSYAHLSEIGVRVGQVVEAGEVIGASGNTGCSKGPHLHLAVARATGGPLAAARPVDPYGWRGEGEPAGPIGAGRERLWGVGAEPPLGFPAGGR
jgi:murein DD-endopeptidase MepM/ murein hydrolase activator NlpD